jgi:hypothetical protein
LERPFELLSSNGLFFFYFFGFTGKPRLIISASTLGSRPRTDRVADREDIFLQVRADLLIVWPASFGKGTKRICRQNIRPKIAVIARAISITCKDMSELRRSVPHDEFLWHPE